MNVFRGLIMWGTVGVAAWGLVVIGAWLLLA